MTLDPVRIQNLLNQLFSAISADVRLQAELQRAQREFFGDSALAYADSPEAENAATVRFVEWFVLERESDLLGGVPVEVMAFGSELQMAAANSRVGLFLVDGVREEIQARDLFDGERLTIHQVPGERKPGDVLVGRFYQVEPDVWVPSVVVTVIPRSPQLAITFQRELKAMESPRRLTQAEVERLVFASLSAQSGGATSRPLERIEADLDTILEPAVGEGVAARISEELREVDSAGEIAQPLLDQLAFETEVDLEAVRALVVEIWQAHRTNAAAAAPETEIPAETEIPNLKRSPKEPKAPEPKPENPKTKFEPKQDEAMGEMLARRIEEGLAGNENVEDLFKHVEELFGESIDEEVPDVGEFEADDITALVREYVWEMEPQEAASAWLNRFVEQQRNMPVPPRDIEHLESDDHLRFLVRTWMEARSPQRAVTVQAAFDALVGFHDWLAEAQMIDRREVLQPCRELLIEELERIERASNALSTSDQPGDGVRLLRVTRIEAEAIHVADSEQREERQIPAAEAAVEALQEGDLVFGSLGANGLVDHVTVVPSGVEHVLG